MTPPLTAEDPTQARLGRSRSRVLEELAAAGVPLGVAELAERVGLHANTVRFHLDALVRDRLAERSAEATHHAGRPRVLYSSSHERLTSGRRSYRLLAEILAGHLAAHSRRPAADAADAGREWGRYLAPPPEPFRRVDAAAATAQVASVLAEIGFVPESGTDRGQRVLRLHHCPFRELAATHGQVVCSVHLGLVQGVLAEIGAPLEARRIEPFVEPSLCLVRLTTRRGATRPAAGRTR